MPPHLKHVTKLPCEILVFKNIDLISEDTNDKPIFLDQFLAARFKGYGT